MFLVKINHLTIISTLITNDSTYLLLMLGLLYSLSVFNRLVRLIADHARVAAAGEASLAQAKSASEAAKRLINDATAQRHEKEGDSPKVSWFFSASLIAGSSQIALLSNHFTVWTDLF